MWKRVPRPLHPCINLSDYFFEKHLTENVTVLQVCNSVFIKVFFLNCFCFDKTLMICNLGKLFLNFANTPNPYIVFQAFVVPTFDQYNRKQKWVAYMFQMTFAEPLKWLCWTLGYCQNHFCCTKALPRMKWNEFVFPDNDEAYVHAACTAYFIWLCCSFQRVKIILLTYLMVYFFICSNLHCYGVWWAQTL